MESTKQKINLKQTLFSEFHTQLQKILNESTLQPMNVEVKNLSCWYYMRKRLGIKKHSAIIVKQNSTTSKYEGFIYDLKRREEDLEIVPKKVLVATQDDRISAYKQCEQAIKERDKHKIIVEEDLLNSSRKQLVLNTHFQITIVSEQFKRKHYLERMILVYHELLQGFGCSVVPNSVTPFTSPPSGMKHFSYFGKNVCAYNFFHFLPEIDGKVPNISLICLTPAQWRPDLYDPLISERLGKSHLNVNSLQIQEIVRPKQQEKRIKKLMTGQIDKKLVRLGTLNSNSMTSLHNNSNTGSFKNSTNRMTNNNKDDALFSSSDTLGLIDQHSISQILSKEQITNNKDLKLGGIYGHFFNDLSQDVREMVLQKYQDNKDLIHKHANLASIEHEYKKQHYDPTKDNDTGQQEFQPVTNISKMKEKVADSTNLYSNYDVGTQSTHEMSEEFYMSTRKIEKAAAIMQRLYRRNYFRKKVIPTYFRREITVIIIQAWIRKIFGYNYFQLLSKLKPIATVKIQRFYRDIKSKYIIRMWRNASYYLTRRVLPKVKLFIKKCYESWLKKRHRKAVIIQKAFRTHFQLRHYYIRHGIHELLQRKFHTAVIIIQKHIRRYLSNKFIFAHQLAYVLHQKVDIPAIIRLQRIFRGGLAKKIFQRKLLERDSANKLQNAVKNFLYNCWQKRYKRALKEKNAAICIQSHYRGYYDRKLVKLKQYFYFYEHVYIPTIIKLQCQCRVYFAKKKVYYLKNVTHAAITIQKSFRNYKLRIKRQLLREQFFKIYRSNYVIIIQRNVRRFLARIHYLQKSKVQYGRVLQAKKIIMRLWKTYKYKMRYNLLLENYRMKIDKASIEKYKSILHDIVLDSKEIKHDISLANKNINKLKSRLKDIDVFLAQAALRLNKIKKEMTLLTMEDYERGWAEALGQEYEYISHQSSMSREEMRLLKHKLYLVQDEILALHLELEENDIEYDHLNVQMVEVMEKSRYRQITNNEKLANYNYNKQIFRERSHWKIESNRKNKVIKERTKYQDIIRKNHDSRNLEYASTINFEKRQQRVDYENLFLGKLLEMEARDKDEISKPKGYEEYAKPVQFTYDNIISNNLETLRGFTLDERAARIRDQYKQKENQIRLTRKGQFAALKENNN